MLVLEARDRVGGRLQSVAADEGHLDLGATWFWPGESRVTDLCLELDLALHRQYLAGDALYEIPGRVERMDGNPLDVPSYRFSGGAASLAEALASTLDGAELRLSSAVTSIRGEGGRLRVETRSTTDGRGDGDLHEIRAEQVVLALPPALAVASIAFAPALPPPVTELATRTPVWMGAMAKVVAHYAAPFWRNRGLSGAALSHVGPLREIHDMSGPAGRPAALFGFAPRHDTAPPVTKREAVDQLVRLFGPEAAQAEAVRIQDWRHEPFTSPPGVGARSDTRLFGAALLRTPHVGGRLHWASTETARVSPGHIEGAIAEGERVADVVWSALR